jgi:hypothetical protein
MAQKIQGTIGGTITVPANSTETFTHTFEGNNHPIINLVRVGILNAAAVADVNAEVRMLTSGDGGDVGIPTIPEGETDDDRRITVAAGGTRIPTLICPGKGDKLRVTIENTSSSERVVNVLASQASAPIIATEA